MKGNSQEFLRITQMEGLICSKIIPYVTYYDASDASDSTTWLKPRTVGVNNTAIPCAECIQRIIEEIT